MLGQYDEDMADLNDEYDVTPWRLVASLLMTIGAIVLICLLGWLMRHPLS